MAPGGFYHCLISSPFNSENISWISSTKTDVLGRVMEGVFHGYFSRRIRLIRLEYPSEETQKWSTIISKIKTVRNCKNINTARIYTGSHFQLTTIMYSFP